MPWLAMLITRRVFQLAGLLVASWCVMTSVHELGHVVCGSISGGTLTSAELRPWHVPYSFFRPDPHPLVTLWGGPIFGALIPLAFAKMIEKHWAWFVAYFCLLANGAYLVGAWISGDSYLDTPKLLERGAHPVSIAIYCVMTVVYGYLGFRRECLRVVAPMRLATQPTQPKK